MKALLYTLRLLEPVLVAQADAGEENSAIGLPYIPGSALRGALIANWLSGQSIEDLATNPLARSLFLDGTVCHLNAYPFSSGKRFLPRPASWMKEKESADDTTAPIYDFAVDSCSELKSPKASGGNFCLLEQLIPEEPWEPKAYETVLLSPAFFEQLHIALEDVNRRGEENTIFRYDALAPGQRFAGAIVGPDDADLSPLEGLLAEGELSLGSARTAGYGRMAVEDVRVVSNWQEYTPYEPDKPERLVLTLLSPAILRGSGGQVGWDGGEALAQALGAVPGKKPTETFGSLTFVGGYNRKWSLPLPQAWALAAGSVFVFSAGDVEPARLQAALDRGIGERRAEGFGRIAANWQVGAQISERRAEEVKPQAPKLSPDSQGVAQAMAQRRLRLLLDARLMARVNADAERLQRPPQNAQLSAIRQATLSAMSASGSPDRFHPLIEHLNNLKKAGRTQLERCRLGNQNLWQWLNERATQLDAEKQLLQGNPLPTVAGVKAELSNDLRLEYTARLIDGVMQLTARRKTEAKS